MKKNVYAFLIKKHLYMLDQAQNKRHLANAKQLITKNSASCLKIRQFFLQSERTDRLDPYFPVRFSSLFIDPAPARRTYILNDPLWIKLTMGQLLLFFLCNFSSFFSYVGGILVTNHFSLLLIDRYILAIQQIITHEEHLRYSF